MRFSKVVGAALACILGFIASSVMAADTAVSDNPLVGTRWMEIGVFDKIENIPLEKLLLLHDCFIADIAFVIEDGKLMRFDRGGLSGNSMPIGYARVDAEPRQDGGTLITLHTASDSGDMPDRYLIDIGGTIMRAQLERGQGSAYMKCERGVGQPATPPAGAR